MSKQSPLARVKDQFGSKDKLIAKLTLDPHLETADIDLGNNTYPPEPIESRFRLTHGPSGADPSHATAAYTRSNADGKELLQPLAPRQHREAGSDGEDVEHLLK